jgi:hypothetical protein
MGPRALGMRPRLHLCTKKGGITAAHFPEALVDQSSIQPRPGTDAATCLAMSAPAPDLI